jgi:hypothetical protein
MLESIINQNKYPISKTDFGLNCKKTLDQHGALMMPDFILPETISTIIKEAEQNQHLVYYTANNHNIYLSPSDPDFDKNHSRNREISSSKGCITTDQIPEKSALHTLYDSAEFRSFLCTVLGEDELYSNGDNLSSINLHYAKVGQELGWHFDNSSFAITMLIQSAADGGSFEYVKDVRDADKGEMNYELSGKILDGQVETNTLEILPGTLVLFRGRNSMHRVTPVKGDTTRLMVVLAYNTEPNVSLSESARMTFFGRLN